MQSSKVLPQQKFTLRIDCPPGGGVAGVPCRPHAGLQSGLHGLRGAWKAKIQSGSLAGITIFSA